ncbi:MAG: insulinase family protein [Ignavibacteria bacterium]|jgi:zinc protease|nr:insulinase family protein [Ignavibacteria bacterium]MCU7501839.1 insulinase family protein [Ignavibacteria bacterium]MCU7514815.1 insulinase family protein [Ignavibacteria bacterium]
MKRTLLSFSALFFILFFQLNAQEISLDSKLPVDPEVKMGKLPNGMTYYIKKNHKPEKRAELRLVVNAGAIQEDDIQNGLAHFSEHMAFNGTKNFKKQEVINFMESIGMRFGPEVNAYTSFDETVYMLQVPTDTIRILEKGFQILEEWAHNVSYENEEIDKERGVIIEEWRLRRGAEARMWDKQSAIMFKGSKYAVHNVLGQKEILEKFDYETLKKFYKDWYRPDLMAVVAVGDFDVNAIEEIIKNRFSGIAAPKNPREHTLSPVLDHKEPYFAIASDKEASGSSVSIYYMRPIEPEVTVKDYRRSIVENLYNNMFNKRLYELSKQADPPFVYAYSGRYDIVRTKSSYILAASVKDNGVNRALETLLREAKRVDQFGFTQGELDRQKKETLRYMEQAFKEKDKTENSSYASEYVANFLTGQPIAGIAYDYELYKKFVPEITVEEINKLASDYIRDENRVITANVPEKEGVVIPKEEELAKIFEASSKEKVTAYVDKTVSEDLLDKAPTPGKITSESKREDLGLTELTLSNGVKVVLKPTNFKNDEILFTSYSKGGNSLAPDSDFVSAVIASSIINEAGVGKFDQIALAKALSGKMVRVDPSIADIQETVSGSGSAADMETMFKLIYLHFTSPRMDSTAFLSFKGRMKAYLENRSLEPYSALQDTLSLTLWNYHLRSYPWTVKTLDKIDLKKAFNFYKDRYGDAGDFTFFFVGNFDVEKIKPFLATYLGSLPTTGRKENWKDTKMEYARGVIEKTVFKGIESKSQVVLSFNGPLEWSQQNIYDLRAMADVLDIKLREVIREEKGGTYGVSVNHGVSHYPKEGYSINISFGCDPKKAEELTNAVFVQLDSLKKFGPAPTYIQKVRETHIKSRETSLKRNEVWLYSLLGAYFNDEDPIEILDYIKLIENISAKEVQAAAQKYLDNKNYVKVILYPEGFKGL